MNEEEYLIDRLKDQIDWYSKKSSYNQKWYKILRLIEIISAALIPFLAGLGSNLEYSKFIIGGLGVIIAIAAGASSLYKYQENWIQYRTNAEMLKHEKYLYLVKAPPYDTEKPLIELVERVENVISQENTRWASYTKKSPEQEQESQ